VKGRGSADGRKQRDLVDPDDAWSPTVPNEEMLLTAMIDAIENRDVAVVDIPGAFMQVDMDDLVHVRFYEKSVEILPEIDHEMYSPCVTYERGEMVLYVGLLKALYGTLWAARLFWEKLWNQLKEWGLTANPYDPCVMNKMVCGKQMTEAWHLNNLKISYVHAKGVDHFIRQLDGIFCKDGSLTKSHGKIHDYLGMSLDFSSPGMLEVLMIDYIKMILADVPPELKARKAASPAANHQFDVRDDESNKVEETRTQTNHQITMQFQSTSTVRSSSSCFLIG
jgi:hypothetical protein